MAYPKRIPELSFSPFATFEALYEKERRGFLLESPNQTGRLEQFSILGTGKEIRIPKGQNPFPFVEDLLRQQTFQNPSHPSLRFTGGPVGFISYDVARCIENLPVKAGDDTDLPFASFFDAEEFILFDHARHEIWIVGENEYRTSHLENCLRSDELSSLNTVDDSPLPHSNFTPAQFMEIVERCKRYIANGDTYQTNLSQRFEIPTKEEGIYLYKKLRRCNPSPFAAFLDFGDFQLISSSPERLVQLEDGVAQTRPIAGTRKRGEDFREDEALTGELLLNEKERAEHLMLVDLERNDLGRVCKYGSVHVDELMAVEKYSHVMHIVSNIRGEIASNKNAIDLLTAMFPGGTITGCPKIRSMEIIEELEPIRRGPYTGSIGYFSRNGNMDMSITIRTIVKIGNKAYVQAGAGIVADSDPEREYWETVQKAKAMLKVLQPVQVETAMQS